MEALILRDTHIDSTTAGSKATQDVGIAIVESIRLNRNNVLSFNQAQATVWLEENTLSYPLPSDFLGMSGDVFFVSGNTVPGTAKRALTWAPLNQLKEYRFTTTSLSELINTGAPMYYGINPTENTLITAPISSSSEDNIEFEYLRDPGTPWYKDVTGTITFYKPNSEDALTSAYTSDWFDLDKGFNLIMYKAEAILWATVLAGTEEAAAKEIKCEQLWAMQMNSMRGDTNRKVGARMFRRWM